MITDNNIFLLKGKLQHYDWGGYKFLPDLLNIENTENNPCAEYWMGAHNSAPSLLIDGENAYPLNELIKQNPEKFLGKAVHEKFGELPYLYKILDVKEMLSIQVHPSKDEAEKGFEREEQTGIGIKAPNRNYKDKNHKPEVMIALSKFWLLHGFLEENKLQEVLHTVPAFHGFKNIFEKEGIKGLYQHVMEMPQEEANTILKPLVEEIMKEERNDKSSPEHWVQKLFKGKDLNEVKDFDKGIFSVYFFNIVEAEKGEAIFQSAGLPHAYLEGQNVELMANSDNVLRGGLTSKYVDVPELLKHTGFEGIVPESLEPRIVKAEKIFDCPVPDFGISEIHLNKEIATDATLQSSSLEILFVMEGGVKIKSDKSELSVHKGQSVVVLPDTVYTISTIGDALLYKAFVPQT